MHLKKLLPLLLLGGAAATAIAADSPSGTATGSVTVTGTRATFDVPTTPEERPKRPDFTLKLPAYKLDSVDYNFPSGLRMIFQSDHSQPVVSITTVYDRGSTSDPIGKEGIAHFVEHLWFRSQHVDQSDPTGQKRLPKTWDILSDLGCDLNASTADDWTNYMSVCPSTSLQALLRLESLRMSNAVEGVVESVVDTEREVIRNELRMRYENTEAQVLPYLFDKLYPDGHPYARLGIGSHASLANCKLADIQEFVKTNYRPENTTVVVVGDFELADVPELIYDNMDPVHFDSRIKDENLVRVPRRSIENPDPKNPEHWFLVPTDPSDPTHQTPISVANPPPKRISGPAAEPPPPGDQTLSTYEAAIDYPMVVLGWTIPGSYRGNDIVMNMTANVAGGYINDYFLTSMADDVRGAGCFTWASKIDSKLICFIELKRATSNPEQIAQRAADQVAFIWDTDYNYNPALNIRYVDTMLSRAKMEYLAEILRSLDLFATVGGGRATDIAHWAHFTGSHQYHSDVMNEVSHIEGQQIVDMAYKYLRRDRMTNIYLKAIPKDEVVVDAAQTSDYHAAQGGDDILRSTYDPKSITAEVIKDYTITPNIDLLIDKKLPNGLRVVVLEHGEAPLVEAGLYVGGGTATEPLGFDEFAEEFGRTLWNDRSRKTDPLRIAGSWYSTRGSNYTYHYVQSSNGNLDGALWLLREAMEEWVPNLDGRTDYAKYLQEVSEDSWSERSYHIDRMQDELNPGHPTTWSGDWSDYEEWKTWTGADVMSYVRRKYQPANATLVIVGNVNGQQAEKLAEYYFQGWKPAKDVEIGPMPTIPPPNPATVQPRVVLLDNPGKTQTDVSFACPIAPATQENDVTRQILTDYVDEQTWVILRENGGVTYGAYAYAYGQPGGSSLFIMGSLVQNEGTVLAVKTFQDLAAAAERGEFESDVIAKHKLNRAKKYVLAQQSVPQMRGRLMSQLIWNNDWKMVTDYPDRLAAVDAAQLQAMMGDCTDHYLITIEGPADAVSPQLDAAGVQYSTFDVRAAAKDLLWKYDPKEAKKAEKKEAKDKKKAEKKEAKVETSGSK